MITKLANLIEQNSDELAALECMNVGKCCASKHCPSHTCSYPVLGKPFTSTKAEIANSIALFRYFGGWADKIHGKTIEVSIEILFYTRLSTIYTLSDNRKEDGVHET